jgi:hypothetical protein
MMVRLEIDEAGPSTLPVPLSPQLRMPTAKHKPQLFKQSPLLSLALYLPILVSLSASQQYTTIRGNTHLALFNLADTLPCKLFLTLTMTSSFLLDMLIVCLYASIKT